MIDIPTPGPDEVVVYRTEHFETRINSSGEGLMRRRDRNDMIYARFIPAQYAAMFTEVAETGYHLGAEHAEAKLSEFASTFERSLVGPMGGCPRPEIEEKDADD